MSSKLFRAIVVMGVSMTASCDDDKCFKCVPVDATPTDTKTADARPTDAGVDAPTPMDAPVDTVLIL